MTQHILESEIRRSRRACQMGNSEKEILKKVILKKKQLLNYNIKVNINKFGGIITTNPSGTNSGCGLLLDNVGKFVNNFSGGQTVSTTVGSARCIIVAVVNAGVRTLWINGTQEGSATASSGNITQSTRVVIGKYRDETGNNGAFDLEALSVFVGTASTTLRQNLEGYFAPRGLAAGLPASHPYRNRPPLIGN